MLSGKTKTHRTGNKMEMLNQKIKELELKLESANERIKRLEEAGDALVNEGWNEPHLANAWRKAKEAKL